jgi:hypothetical protein
MTGHASGPVPASLASDDRGKRIQLEYDAWSDPGTNSAQSW